MKDRGQLYTLEGVIAGLILLAGLLFAIQATATSPGSGGGPGLNAIEDDRTIAHDVLYSAEQDTLEQAVMYWSRSGDGFFCSPSGVTLYPGETEIASGSNNGECNEDTTDGIPSPDPSHETFLPPNEFGQHLSTSLSDRYSYNVRIGYHTSPDTIVYEPMVYQGEPGSGAVRARRSISITNEQPYYEADGTASSTRLRDDKSSFYAPPVDDGVATDDNLYNTLHVEVIVWRP